MPVPPDEQIMFELLRLLSESPEQTLESAMAYEKLAGKFPNLTDSEINDPYQNSVSFWANRVQWARAHCVKRGLIYRPDDTRHGSGFWTLTKDGLRFISMFQAVPDSTAINPATLRALFHFDASD